mgnify:CR=1 FL=1
MLVNEETGKSKVIPESFTIFLLNKDGKLVKYFKPSKNFDELKKEVKKMLTRERLSTKLIRSAKGF